MEELRRGPALARVLARVTSLSDGSWVRLGRWAKDVPSAESKWALVGEEGLREKGSRSLVEGTLVVSVGEKESVFGEMW